MKGVFYFSMVMAIIAMTFSIYAQATEQYLDLEKYTNDIDADTAPGPYLNVGSTVTWKYVITNTSKENIDNLYLFDDQEGVIQLPETSLHGGESITVTKTGIVRAGQYANVATVTGTHFIGETPEEVEDSDASHYYGISASPSIDVEKYTNDMDADTPPGPTIARGQLVTWKYIITNTGNIRLGSITLNDNRLGNITLPKTLLDPGESIQVIRTGTATVGQYANTATVTAYTIDYAGSEIIVTDSDPSHYYGIQANPAIDLKKYVNDLDANNPTGPYITVGSSITYKFVVTNTGNVALGGLQVIDDHLGNLGPFTDVMLEPGQSTTIIRTGTAIAGQQKNTATASASYLGTTVQDQDVAHYYGINGQPNPSIDIEKYTNNMDADQPTGPYIASGSTVTWKYIITNNGNLPLRVTEIRDNKLGVLTLPVDPILDPGETWTLTRTGTAVAGQYTNTATVTAYTINYAPAEILVTDSDPSHYYGTIGTPQPSVDVEKKTNGEDADIPPGPSIPVGATVTWTYIVTNNGNTPIELVQLKDDKLGIIWESSSPGTATMAPGATRTFTRSGIATAGQYRNVVTVTAYSTEDSPAEILLTDSDSSHYLGIVSTPAIDIEKYTNDQDADTPTGPYLPIGSTVTWKYVITNTGNVALGGLQVVDDQLGNLGPFIDVMLEPGQSTTITRTGIVVGGQHRNTATVTATYLGQTVTDTDPSHYFGINGEPNPSIDIEKYVNNLDADVAPGPSIQVGSTVTWTYTITNNGNVPLRVLEIIDDRLGNLAVPSDGVLHPGETWTLTRTGTAIAGQYRNVATVKAREESDMITALITDSDPAYYYGTNDVPQPSVDLEKLINGQDADIAPGPQIPAGESITWTYIVTNNSNTPIEVVSVKDDKIGTIWETSSSNRILLQPGENRTWTRSGIAILGQYKNTATVNAYNLSGSQEVLLTDSDVAQYLGIEPRPAIDLEKHTNDVDADNPTGPLLPVGSTVTWKYIITNTGNVALGGLSVMDSELGNLGPFTDVMFEPGQTITITRTGIVRAGQYKNTATATATYMGQTVSDTDVSHYYGIYGEPRPAIDIEKTTNGQDADTPPGPTVPVGSTVEWRYVIKNTGNVPLRVEDIHDNQLGSLGVPEDPILDPNEVWTLTRTGIAIIGQYANKATVNAYNLIGTSEQLVTDSDFSHYLGVGLTPAIDIEKYTNNQDADVAPGPTLSIGSPVTWKYVITNTGNITLTILSVFDDKEGMIPLTSNRLEAGQSITLTKTGIVQAGQYRNEATVRAEYESPNGKQTISDTDPSHYFGVQGNAVPKIDIEKKTNGEDADTPPGPNIPVGEAVTWTFIVSNTGNTPIALTMVKDDHLGTIWQATKAGELILQPGESRTFTRTGTANLGQYRNVAMVNGVSVGAEAEILVSDSDPSHYLGFTPQPAIDIEKYTNDVDADLPTGPIVPVGSTVTWKYVVKNTGNVALGGLQVVDDKLGNLGPFIDVMFEPGQTITITRTGIAVAGQHKNTVTASATYLGQKVQDQDPSHYFGIQGEPQPKVDIEKYTNNQDADLPPGPSLAVGSTVSWKYVIKNTGNVPIELDQVKDDKLGIIWESGTSGSMILSVGETRTFTRTGTVAAGQYENTATVFAHTIIGSAEILLTDSDKSHYVGIEANPSIDIEKYTNDEDADEAPGPFIPVGQTVTWKYVVRNTGNVPLAGVTVRDDKLGLIGVHIDVFFEPGQSFTLTKTGIAEPGLYKNIGTVTATYNGMSITDSDPSHYYGSQGNIQPSIDIEKYTNGEDADNAPGPTIPIGETVTWTYIITNDGNIPLDIVRVTDDKLGDLILPSNKRLNPGQSITLKRTGKATEGQYVNQATVEATNPNAIVPVVYRDTDVSHYFGVRANPSIDIEKYTNGVDADMPPGPAIPIGQTVTWLYVIKNTGNVALGGLNVVDDKLGSLGPFIDVMFEPGKTITITRTGVAVAGQYRNNAVASATYLGLTVKDEDPSHYYGVEASAKPAIDIEKYTNDEDADAAPGPYIPVGQPVTWKYVITNIGNVPLTIDEVVDSKLGKIPLSVDVVLKPAQSITLTKTGTAKAGQYKNEAVVKAIYEEGENKEVVTDKDLSHYFGLSAEPRPAIDIEKYTNGEDADHAPGPRIPAGSMVTWTYIVKNTGNVPLKELVVNDDKLGLIYTGASTAELLNPGETKMFTRRGTAIVGSYENIAKASAKYGNTIVEDFDKSHYFGESGQDFPAIDIEKYTNNEDADVPPGPAILIGQPVTWKYVVKNIGTVPLENLRVVDDQLGVVNPPLDVVLEPGKTLTFTKTGTAVAGQYRNVAEATAEYQGAVVRDSDTSHYLGKDQEKASIDVEKYSNGEDADVPPGPSIPIGSTVTWKYMVKNNGNVTLTDVTLSDDKLGHLVLPSSSIAPGVMWTITKTGTAAAGQYRNTAKVTAKYNTEVLSDEDPSHYFGIEAAKPAIDIEKSTNGLDADTPPGAKVAVGSPVTWVYKVRNTGNVPLKELMVSDDQLGIIYIGYNDAENYLGVGEERIFTRTGTAVAGQYRNVAKATARYENITVSDEDPSHYFGGEGDQPAIDIEKSTNGEDADTPPGPSILVGQSVKWEYSIKNIGNVPLWNLKVVDDQLGEIPLPTTTVLNPGESIKLIKTGKAVAGQYANIATVTGEYNGKTTKDSDPSHYFGSDQPKPSIDLEKTTNGEDADTPPGPTIEIGSTVTWQYVIRNTGNITLNNLSLTDDQLGKVLLPSSSLAPGQSMVVNRTGGAVAGQYANVAKVTATANDQTVEDQDASHYIGVDPKDAQASIDVEKYVEEQDADTPPGVRLPIGRTVIWKYVITNTGSVPLTNILLTDDQEGAIALPVNSLEAGQSVTITSNDIVKAGQYANMAIVSGNFGPTIVTDRDPAHYFGEQERGPQIDIEKSTNGEDADTVPGPYVLVGSRITWKYVITNTGTVRLMDVSLMDDKEGKIFLPQTTLDVGKSLTIYRTGTAIAGQYENIARVTAKAGEITVEDSDPSHYFGTNEPMPAIDVQKYTNGEDADVPPGPSIYIGKPVTWQYTIKNTGNVALTNVTLTDDKIGPILLPTTSLSAGQSLTVSKQGIATMGQYRNVARVTAQYNDRMVEANDASHYFGNLGNAGGRVFEDRNRNSRLDPEEPLLGGWSIELFNESTQQSYITQTLNENSTTISQKRTSAMLSNPDFGKWFFPPEVPPGIYIVRVLAPNEWMLLYPNTFNGKYRLQYAGFGQYTLLSEAPSDFIDLTFGVARMQHGSIVGYVFYDSNIDGKRNPNEVGLKDVTVELYHNGVIAAKSLTDDRGLYQFNHLLPGAYVINVDESTLPPQYVLTTNNEPHFVDLTRNLFYSGADFGYVRSLKDWGLSDRWLLARYQSWYGDAANPQSLRHWDVNNNGGHVHHSLIGSYDSNDPNVLEYHILSAWAAGIDGFVVDWFGKDTYENQALLNLLTKTQQLTTQFARHGFNFEVATMYRESSPSFNNKIAQEKTVIDLSYLGDFLLKHPAYWGTRRGVSNPVYWLYETEPSMTPEEFRQQANLPPTASVVWNGFLRNILGSVDAYAPSLEKLVRYLKPDGSEWGDAYLDSTYYAMNYAAEMGMINFAVGQVWAGYDDRPYVFGAKKWMDRREGTVYDGTWEKIHNYEYPLYMPWVMIDSWNGWNQGTEIEPSIEYGFDYLKKTRNHVRIFKQQPILAAKGMDNLGLLVPLHIYQARTLRQTNTHLATTMADMLDVAMQSFFNGEHLLAISIADLAAGLAPKPLHLLNVDETSVQLGWERSPNADGYRLYYSDHPEAFAPLSSMKPFVIELGNTQEYTLKNLQPNSEIYVGITALHRKSSGFVEESWYENLLTGAEIMKIKIGQKESSTPAKLVYVQGIPLAGEALQFGRPWITEIYGMIPDFQSPTLSQIPGEIPSDPYWTIFRFDDYGMHSFATFMLQLSSRSGASTYAPTAYFEVLVSNQSIRPTDFISIGFFECSVDGRQHWYSLSETISAQFLMLKPSPLTWNAHEYQIDAFSVLTEKGATSVSSDEHGKIPTIFRLEQNYPNPFNGVTRIDYQLPETAHVTLRIYNINGQLVETVVDKQQAAGYYSIQWQNRTKASGLYFYHLNAGKYSAVKRMVLVK